MTLVANVGETVAIIGGPAAWSRVIQAAYSKESLIVLSRSGQILRE